MKNAIYIAIFLLGFIYGHANIPAFIICILCFGLIVTAFAKPSLIMKVNLVNKKEYYYFLIALLSLISIVVMAWSVKFNEFSTLLTISILLILTLFGLLIMLKVIGNSQQKERSELLKSLMLQVYLTVLCLIPYLLFSPSD